MITFFLYGTKMAAFSETKITLTEKKEKKGGKKN